ncbi:MAG: ASCH domain-containing protein [Akkermansiaceae bacterium]
MKALSIKQPWAWAIVHVGKNIENRSRRTHYRGTVAVHASLGIARDWAEWYPARTKKPPAQDEWALGAIIGFVDIIDCVEDYRSKWFYGPFGYRLANPVLLKQPVPCRGALGLWTVPPQIVRKINRQK